jgi:multidrug resistance efflux pump
MLNISDHRIDRRIDQTRYSAFSLLGNRLIGRRVKRFFLLSGLLSLGFLFLPWTQNVESNGRVTTLRPADRPQNVESAIPGRIAAWHVQEGDTVTAGDTLVLLTEVKDDYFDPELIQRTAEQLAAKVEAVQAYADKVLALDRQLEALRTNRRLKIESAVNKIEQARLKVSADSMARAAAGVALGIARDQLRRQEELFEQGLKSLTELEARRAKFQEAQAKSAEADAKLLSAQRSLLNARIDRDDAEAEYNEKIAKAEGDRFTTLGAQYAAEGERSKLQNTLANYTLRAGLYALTAPRNGIVTRALQAGIGETIKEGTPVLTIVPEKPVLAVEIFVPARDLPLLSIGSPVQFLFDGWPALVFSGWPRLTYGTFAGQVYAIDRAAGKDGRYRVLVSEVEGQPWPAALRVGSGARGIALLKEVQIWYEIWRQLNGFPPDFYTDETQEKEENGPFLKKPKAPKL